MSLRELRKKHNIMMSADEETVILCAMRYSVGRMTYMPELVADYIRDNWKYVSNKQQFLRDLEREMESSGSLGMECDENTWKSLLQFMQENI